MRTYCLSVALLCVTIAATDVHGDTCEDAPAFIRMYGQWEPVAVRSEPASILDEFTYWAQPHAIVGFSSNGNRLRGEMEHRRARSAGCRFVG